MTAFTQAPDAVINMIAPSSPSLGPKHAPEKAAEAKPTNSPDEDLQASLGTKDGLGAALTKQGRYDEAAALLQDVLDARERLGQSKSDPNTLRTMNNLGAALSRQGHFADAEILHRQVLAADMQRLGSEHADTLTSMHNLADVLTRQDKLVEARDLQQRALAGSRIVHGPEAPATLAVMGNLADMLRRQHEYERAEALSREVLALRRKVLGPWHPDLATAMHNLASLLRARGKLEEAEELARQEAALPRMGREEMASGSDPVPGARSHYDEVERRLRDQVRVAVEASGRESRDAQAHMRKLADVLIRNGKYQEAEDVFREVLVAGAA